MASDAIVSVGNGNHEHGIIFAKEPLYRPQRTLLPAQPTSGKASQPKATKRKPKAPALRDHIWQPHMARLKSLYNDQNLPLRQVMEIMKDTYNFVATERQYRSRLSKWELDKNIKTHEMVRIAKRVQHVGQSEKSTHQLAFQVRGRTVPQSKIKRFIRTKGLPMVVDSTSDTPDSISVNTESDFEMADYRDTSKEATNTTIFAILRDELSSADPDQIQQWLQFTISLCIQKMADLENMEALNAKMLGLEVTELEDAVPLEDSFSFSSPTLIHHRRTEYDTSTAFHSTDGTLNPATLALIPSTQHRLERWYNEARDRALRNEILFLQTTPLSAQIETLYKIEGFADLLSTKTLYKQAEEVYRRLLCTICRNRHHRALSCKLLHSLIHLLECLERNTEAVFACRELVGFVQESFDSGSHSIARAKLIQLLAMLKQPTRYNKETRDIWSEVFATIEHQPWVNSSLTDLSLQFIAKMPLHFWGPDNAVEAFVEKITFEYVTHYYQDGSFSLIAVDLAEALHRLGQRDRANKVLLCASSHHSEQIVSERCGELSLVLHGDATVLIRTMARQGLFNDAEKFGKRVIETITQTEGPYCRSILKAQGALADVYEEQDLLDEAGAILKSSLDTSLTSFGPASVETLEIVDNLVDLCEKKNDHGFAHDLLVNSLPTRLQLFGADHDKTIRCAARLGTTYLHQNQLGMTLQLLSDHVASNSNLNGNALVRTLSLKEDIAFYHHKHGNFDKAIELFSECMHLNIDIEGEKSPQTLNTKECLALVLERQGRHAEAYDLYSECLAVRVETHGLRHEATLSTMSEIARCSKTRCYYDAASQTYSTLVGLSTDLYGPKHKRTLQAKYDWAYCLESINDYDSALNLYHYLIAVQPEVYGAKDAATLSTLARISFCLSEKGDYDSAVTMFEKYLTVGSEVLGPMDRDILEAADGFAYALCFAGHFERAVAVLEQNLQLRVEVNGKYHEDTELTRENLGKILRAVKEYRQEGAGSCDELETLVNA